MEVSKFASSVCGKEVKKTLFYSTNVTVECIKDVLECKNAY